MKTKRVVVLPYDFAWKDEFRKIKAELEAALCGLYARIEHVGSTSVEGLSAKPIIDIDIVIKSSADFEKIKDGLSLLGYVHEGNLGIEGREAFAYSGKEHLKTHHLYVCTEDSPELHRHITFRDFLRNNPDASDWYGSVKLKAAELFPDDIEKYIQYKSDCIAELYKRCGL